MHMLTGVWADMLAARMVVGRADEVLAGWICEQGAALQC
jgi:hypothetical protein